MNRQELNRRMKYPNTETFNFYNANPKGRFTGDCSVRGISTATGVEYNEVVKMFADMWIEAGLSYDDTIPLIMEQLGWVKHRQPRKKNGKKYTGKEFCKVQQSRQEKDGIIISPRIFCNIGGNHVVAIIDGKVQDTWDSTDGCIGNYWTKEA